MALVPRRNMFDVDRFFDVAFVFSRGNVLHPHSIESEPISSLYVCHMHGNQIFGYGRYIPKYQPQLLFCFNYDQWRDRTKQVFRSRRRKCRFGMFLPFIHDRSTFIANFTIFFRNIPHLTIIGRMSYCYFSIFGTQYFCLGEINTPRLTSTADLDRSVTGALAPKNVRPDTLKDLPPPPSVVDAVE